MGNVVPLGIPVKSEVVKDVDQLADVLMKQLAIMITGVAAGTMPEWHCIKFKCETIELAIAIEPIVKNPHKPMGGHISPTLMNNNAIQLLELAINMVPNALPVMQQLLSVINTINNRLDVSWLVDLTTDKNAAGYWVSLAQHYRFNETHNIIYQIQKIE